MKLFVAPLMMLALFAALPAPVVAQDEAAAEDADEGDAAALTVPKGKFPRYASIKKSEVNVRSGPGTQYPILWVYQRPGYPVQLLTRYDNYYKIRDAEGEEGWLYITMVSGQRTALVAGHDGNITAPAPLYRKDDTGSPVEARLAPGVVVVFRDEACPGILCKVETGGYKGWVPKADLLMAD